MPYIAENKIQADNGLQFWRDQLPPEYTKEIHSLGQSVFVKRIHDFSESEKEAES